MRPLGNFLHLTLRAENESFCAWRAAPRVAAIHRGFASRLMTLSHSQVPVLTMAQFLYAFRVWAYTYVPNTTILGSNVDGWWLSWWDGTFGVHYSTGFTCGVEPV